jgi:uncharacterized OB-fold protein
LNTEVSEPVLFPPMPQPDELTAFFWEGVERHQFLVMRCDACGTYVHPPRGSCPKCLSTSLAPHEMSGRATLVTWTQPVQPFDPYFTAHQPYTFATVNLVEQEPLRFATNIVDCEEEDLRIDLPLVVTFREVAPGCTLPLFRPAP